MPKLALVEDDLSIRQLLAMLIRAEGWEVADFEVAEEAIAYLSTNPVDAIILDVWLPDLSGIEASRRLRANSVMAPILLVTAGNVDQLSEQLDGLENVVRKDKWLKPEDIRASLQAALENGTFA